MAGEMERDEITEILDELEETVDKAGSLAQMLPEDVNAYEYNRLVSELTGSYGPYIGTGVPDYIKGYRDALDEDEAEDDEELDCPACKRTATVGAWEGLDGKCPHCGVDRDEFEELQKHNQEVVEAVKVVGQRLNEEAC